MELIMQLVGFLGMFLVLIAFTLLKLNKINHEELFYNILNLFGSLFLVLSAIYSKTYAFVLLNSVWVVFSIVDILRKRH